MGVGRVGRIFFIVAICLAFNKILAIQDEASYQGRSRSRSGVPTYCAGYLILNKASNVGVPQTLDDMLVNGTRRYKEVGESAKLWHNFKESVNPKTSSEMKLAMVGAVLEYGLLMKARKYHIDGIVKIYFRYLDADFPNRKFVEIDGHKEVVYNVKTRQIVDKGVNQSTANVSTSQFSPKHISDIWLAAECITPTDVHNEIGKMLAENPYLLSKWIHVQSDWELMHEMAKKLGLPTTDFICLSEEAYRQASERTRSLFSGKKTDDSTQVSCLQADHKRRDLDDMNGNSNEIEARVGQSVDSQRNNIGGQTSSSGDSQVGVRGWCRCGENHGRFYLMGMGAELDFKADESGFDAESGDYTYRLCGRCGRVDRPWRKKGADGEVRIRDNRIEKKYGEQAGDDIPLAQYEAMLRQSEDRLLDIPDGQIVIPGMCRCNEPDPIRTGFVDSQEEFFVCCFCGRVRVLDETGEMPIGPTAWAAMMGNSKPFPGYGNRKK